MRKSKAFFGNMNVFIGHEQLNVEYETAYAGDRTGLNTEGNVRVCLPARDGVTASSDKNALLP